MLLKEIDSVGGFVDYIGEACGELGNDYSTVIAFLTHVIWDQEERLRKIEDKISHPASLARK